MTIKQLFLEKCQKSTCLKWTYAIFGHNYRVSTFSTLYLTVIVNGHTDFLVMIIELFRFFKKKRNC